LPLFADGAEFVQMAVAIADLPWRGFFDERKRLDFAQLERGHAQDHVGQRGTQDFRVGKRRAALKSSSAYSRTATPAATRPQRPERWRADACDRLDLQPLTLAASCSG
jgi:hypothetical protein